MFARAAVLGLFLSISACAVQPTGDDGASATRDESLRGDCALVRCAEPVCGEGQHVGNQGGCCPVCVGQPSRCATILCAAVACAEGEQLVRSKGDCCGHCVKTPRVATCTTSDDCPQIYCFACPCPISECVGRKCVTSTPDPSTCGATQ